MRKFFLRFYSILEFLQFYVREVVFSNIRVARDVLTPRFKFRPGIIQVPVGDLNDRQLLVMANLVTMTPGTLSINVTPDRQFLVVHSMYVDDPVVSARELEEKFSRRIRRVL